MAALNLGVVADRLAAGVEEMMGRQVMRAGDADHGGVIQPAWGLADPCHGGAALLVAGCGYLLMLQPDDERQPARIERMRAALAYMLRVQRQTGRVDLRDCNYDSGPDTAFVVQLLCPMLELLRRDGVALPADIAEMLDRFLRAAVAGVMTGGFHTPNHRWVVASALAAASQVFADIDVAPVVNQYLAEGIDIDAEGAYIERSVAIYDAVCDRSLLMLADYWDFAPGLEAARRNLAMDMYLLHADGTAETGLSHRQDYGTRVVPAGLIACALHASALQHDSQLLGLADWLWEKARAPGVADLVWTAWVMHRLGQGHGAEPGLVPADYARHFPVNGLWRLRRGPLSASVFAGVTRLMTLTCGAAEISSVKIAHAYFGAGRFVGDALTVADGVVTLRSEGRANPRRPGYELPLGRDVPKERWGQMLAERDLRRVPACAAELQLREIPGGLECLLRSTEALDRVATQIAIDFAPGGVWETEDTALKPAAGQVLFLRRGLGRMRYGNDTIEVGPGADAHRMWSMRDTEPAPGHVRVVIALKTPVEHRFVLTCRGGI